MPADLKKIVSVIDYTSLNSDDSVASIQQLCERAITPLGPVAAVCVYPQFVAEAARKLRQTSVAIATVVNFPDGQQALPHVAEHIIQAIKDGATEIDAVLPYERYRQGQINAVREYISCCRSLCGNTVTLKIILETGALSDHDLIAGATDIAIQEGADFIKTSTGKIAVGATYSAAETILQVIAKQSCKRNIGFKVSGGVSTIEEAEKYIALTENILSAAWIKPQTFRIGASRLLAEILTAR